MSLQVLTIKLDGITAGDYLAWCRDPDPPALDLALRSVSVDADPLGDTVTATLDWNRPPPPPPAAAAAAGLSLLPAARIHPLTTRPAAARRRASVEGHLDVVDEVRPANGQPDHQNVAHKRPHQGAAGERSGRHLRHRSEGGRAGTSEPPQGRRTGSPLQSPERAQVERELTLAITDLGGATFALAHHGALTDERLASRVRQIHGLFAQLNALDHPTRTGQQDDEPATALAA